MLALEVDTSREGDTSIGGAMLLALEVDTSIGGQYKHRGGDAISIGG